MSLNCPLSVLIKPVSASCNMRCKYCFYHDVSQHRECKSYGAMSRDTLKNVVVKALDEAAQYCTFNFQGGEPTLAGLQFYCDLIDIQRQNNRRNIAVYNTIQTNGLLLDAQWVQFLAKHNFLVGLSLDGQPQLHNSFRLNSRGEGTFDDVIHTIELMREYQVQFNILTVVTAKTTRRADKLYSFYKKHDLRYVQLINCLDPLPADDYSNSALTASVSCGLSYAPKSGEYGKFLCDLFDLWYEDMSIGNYYSINLFDNYIRTIAGQPPVNCAAAGQCKAYPVIEGNGNVYPCDFYVLDKFELGNINADSYESLLGNDTGRSFAKVSHKQNVKCADCICYFVCRGGCRRERVCSGDNGLLHRYCEDYKHFFNYALPRLKQIGNDLFKRQ